MNHNIDNNASRSSEELEFCPLCLEELDITDKNFKPCTCGYQICLWCFHNINEKVDGKCPNCRSLYQQDKVVMSSMDPELIEAAREERLRKKKETDKRASSGRLSSSSSSGAISSMVSSVPGSLSCSKHGSKDHLQNIRIMQRNLVYVIGLSANIAKEDILKKKDYFGKYGNITKIAINKRQPQTTSQRSSCSVYITYKREEDALHAIEGTNNQLIDGKVVKATFGTTKYCSFFLRNATCSNPNCLYLHQIAPEEDCFLKDDLSAYDRYCSDETLFGACGDEGMTEHAISDSRESSNSRERNVDLHSNFPPIESNDINLRARPSSKPPHSLRSVDTSNSHHVEDKTNDLHKLVQQSLVAAVKTPPNPSSNVVVSSNPPGTHTILKHNELGQKILPKKDTPTSKSHDIHSSSQLNSDIQTLQLPGLTSFGVGRSNDFGWTPAKEKLDKSSDSQCLEAIGECDRNNHFPRSGLHPGMDPKYESNQHPHLNSAGHVGSDNFRMYLQQPLYFQANVQQTNLLKGLLGIGTKDRAVSSFDSYRGQPHSLNQNAPRLSIRPHLDSHLSHDQLFNGNRDQSQPKILHSDYESSMSRIYGRHPNDSVSNRNGSLASSAGNPPSLPNFVPLSPHEKFNQATSSRFLFFGQSVDPLNLNGSRSIDSPAHSLMEANAFSRY